MIEKTAKAALAPDARLAALRLLAAVVNKKQPLAEVLARAQGKDGGLAELPRRDQALARLIVLTCLRRLPQIGQVLSGCMAKPLPDSRSLIRLILVTGVAQLLFLDMPPHAVLSRTVDMCGRVPGGERYRSLVNAVLRRVSRGDFTVIDAAEPGRLNTPGWLWRSWCEAYGPEAAGHIAAVHLREPPLDLTVRDNPSAWAARLGGTVLPGGTVRLMRAGAVPRLEGFGDGQWWVQDAAAALPARLLEAKPGMRVLDMCAAPGGKTAQLALSGAEITALDRSAARLNVLRQNMARLSLEVNGVRADALEWAAPQPFDAILLDAPCSSTGTIRRHPDVARLKQPADVKKLAVLQQKLLARAVELLRPGGVLVYCTCSLQPEEGEAQTEAFLAQHRVMKRRAIAGSELPLVPGAVNARGEVRILPSMLAVDANQPGGLDGFFMVRLEKTLRP
jgi:16S rRNA (cytosine967-C5)-methyltransferase